MRHRKGNPALPRASPTRGKTAGPNPNGSLNLRLCPARGTRGLLPRTSEGGRRVGGIVWCLLLIFEGVRSLGSVEAVRRIRTAKIILGRASSDRAKAGYRYAAGN
jgi:hypothetical protein